MNTAVAEAAYGSDGDGIKSNQVAFSWEDSDKRLVITPKIGPAYSSTPTPITYSFTIAGTVADKAGNSLGTAFVSSFGTLCILFATLATENIDGAIEDDGAGNRTVISASSPAFADIINSINSPPFKRFCYCASFSFSLLDLPEDAKEITAADLLLYTKEYPNPNLEVQFLVMHADNDASLDAGDFNGPLFSGSSIETVNLGDQVTNHLNVAEWLQASIDAGGDRFQVRLWMDGCATLSVDAKYGYDINTSEASSNKPQLVVSYLAP